MLAICARVKAAAAAIYASESERNWPILRKLYSTRYALSLSLSLSCTHSLYCTYRVCHVEFMRLIGYSAIRNVRNEKDESQYVCVTYGMTHNIVLDAFPLRIIFFGAM